MPQRHGVGTTRHFAYIEDVYRDGLGSSMLSAVFPSLAVALRQDMPVICNPALFQIDVASLGDMGRFFGCASNSETSGAFMPKSLITTSQSNYREWSSEVNVVNVSVAEAFKTNMQFCNSSRSNDAILDNSSIYDDHVVDRARARVDIGQHSVLHVVDWCPLTEQCSWGHNNCGSLEPEELYEADIDMANAMKFIRNQFHVAMRQAAIHSEMGESLESIWAGRANRLAVHMRIGVGDNGILAGPNADPERLVSADAMMVAIQNYLKDQDHNDVAIVVVAEAAAGERAEELAPFHKLMGPHYTGLHVRFLVEAPKNQSLWLWSEDVDGNPISADQRAAQSQVARALAVMGSSTALVMSKSSFSLLGAALQRPDALKIMPGDPDVFNGSPSASVCAKWGWFNTAFYSERD